MPFLIPPATHVLSTDQCPMPGYTECWSNFYPQTEAKKRQIPRWQHQFDSRRRQNASAVPWDRKQWLWYGTRLRVPAPEDIKNSRLFKAIRSIIQGLLPVNHSAAYNPTGTWEKNTPIWSIRAWRLLIISGLSSSSTRLIATMAGSSHSHQVLLKVSHRQIPNFSRPSTHFPKQFKHIFSFMKFKDFSRLALNSRPAQEPCNITKRSQITEDTAKPSCLSEKLISKRVPLESKHKIYRPIWLLQF